MDILTGRRRGAVASLTRGALAVASVPYAAAMRVRRWAYRCGVLPSKAVRLAPANSHAHEAASSAPGTAAVISIGNITTGGTGKTPMVAYVVDLLRHMGRRPAVVMRGYKSIAGRSDEAEMLKHLCNGGLGCVTQACQDWAVPVIVNPDRLTAARQGIAAGADVIVLDDAFQHLRIRRDLDIVLIDATNPFGLGHVLPRGLLREPPSALQHAHAIVITRSDCIAPDELAALRSRLEAIAPQASLHLAVHRPVGAIDEHGAMLPPDKLRGMKFYAFCGLGNPAAFFDTLRMLNVQLADERGLDDHCQYTPQLLGQLSQEARRQSAPRLITTQKDYVKLADLANSAAAHSGGDELLPIWQLAVQMDIVEGTDKLAAKIGGCVAEKDNNQT